MLFTAHHSGTDERSVASHREAFADDQWIGDRYTEEQAIEAMVDRFKRAADAELQLIELWVVSKAIVDDADAE